MAYAAPAEVHQHLRTITETDLEEFPGYAWFDHYCTEDSPRPLTRIFKQACALGGTATRLEPLVWRINESLRNDVVNTKLSLPYSTATEHSGMARDTCSLAEPYFNDAYRQMMDDEYFSDAPHQRLSVYHGDNGRPLLFRKQHDVSTALSLTTLVDERSGLMLPSGTIIGVAARDTLASKTGEKTISRDHYKTQLASYHLDLSRQPLLPLRLSPWAFREQLNRDIFAIGHNKYFDGSEDSPHLLLNEKRLRTIRERSIDDFRHVGSEILDLCFRTDDNVYL